MIVTIKIHHTSQELREETNCDMNTYTHGGYVTYL